MVISADSRCSGLGWRGVAACLSIRALSLHVLLHSCRSLETYVPSSSTRELYLAMWARPGVDALNIDSNKRAISSIWRTPWNIPGQNAIHRIHWASGSKHHNLRVSLAFCRGFFQQAVGRGTGSPKGLLSLETPVSRKPGMFFAFNPDWKSSGGPQPQKFSLQVPDL